jgi:ubiquinone/menaquinone biosynthesis C-methylase UbiE
MIIENEYGDPTKFYNDFYDSVICKAGLGARSVRATHKGMEASYLKGEFRNCLELGGGNGEHLNFVKHGFDRYFLLDLRSNNLDPKWTGDPRIQRLVGDAEDVPFPDKTFDRIIVTCLLHHVNNPEKVFLEINRLLRSGGLATIFLPCDPGLLVRFARFLTTARKASRLGFKGYSLMIVREHRNHIGGLLTMLKFVFRSEKVSIQWRPFFVRSWNLNAYVIVNVGKKVAELDRN